MDTIDPQIKNLVSSIGQAETGASSPQAYQTKGASGEFGRYQFMPDTWNEWSKQYGVDPNDKSVAAQNKVAYMKVKEWKNAGLNPAQIASKWNSGDENAYKNNHVGVNDKGVKYDTPTYTAKVSQYYNQLKGGQTPTTKTPTEQPQNEASGVGGFLKGLVRAPLTMLARPFQLGAELAGASAEDVNKVNLGGLIAPVPQNMGDVTKDIGRGAQTVALGLGPVAGGAVFGAGNSLEQGNDLFSVQTAFQTVLGAGAGKILDLVGKPLLDAAGKVIGKITPQVLKDVASKGANAISEFAANHNILPEGASNAVNNTADKLSSIGVKPNAIKVNADMANLQERISPKPTISEVRLAQDQGRLVPGKKGGIFTSGTSPTITPTDKVVQASETINKYIPNHAELSDPELSTTIKSKVGEIATNLEPKMQEVKITPENVKKIYADSAKVRDIQKNLGDTADSKAIIKKSQADFKSIIETKKVSTMDDLWKRTQTYDNSIPPNVKNANINSPEGLQLKKQLWLQNRKVLTDITHNVSTGLDEKSAQAFSDMSDMYEAQKGLRSRAKITSPQPSKVSQLVNSKGFRAVKTGAELVGGGYALDKISKATTGFGL